MREMAVSDPLSRLPEWLETRPELTGTRGGFRCRARQLFFTYPATNLCKYLVLFLLRHLFDPVQVMVAQETHQDGSNHLHALIKLRGQTSFSDPRYGDLYLKSGWLHGDYRPVVKKGATLSGWNACFLYLQKEDKDPALFGFEGDLQMINTSIKNKKAPYMASVGRRVLSGDSLYDIFQDHPQLLVERLQQLQRAQHWVAERSRLTQVSKLDALWPTVVAYLEQEGVCVESLLRLSHDTTLTAPTRPCFGSVPNTGATPAPSFKVGTCIARSTAPPLGAAVPVSSCASVIPPGLSRTSAAVDLPNLVRVLFGQAVAPTLGANIIPAGVLIVAWCLLNLFPKRNGHPVRIFKMPQLWICASSNRGKSSFMNYLGKVSLFYSWCLQESFMGGYSDAHDFAWIDEFAGQIQPQVLNRFAQGGPGFKATVKGMDTYDKVKNMPLIVTSNFVPLRAWRNLDEHRLQGVRERFVCVEVLDSDPWLGDLLSQFDHLVDYGTPEPVETPLAPAESPAQPRSPPRTLSEEAYDSEALNRILHMI